MLFQGFSSQRKAIGGGNPWTGHPFNVSNNINGINGDPSGNDNGEEVHSLIVPAITSLQEAYVRKVVDTLNDLDNVLYEISGDAPSSSRDWQYHMINYLKMYQATKPKQHPVGMSYLYLGRATIYASPSGVQKRYDTQLAGECLVYKLEYAAKFVGQKPATLMTVGYRSAHIDLARQLQQ